MWLKGLFTTLIVFRKTTGEAVLPHPDPTRHQPHIYGEKLLTE